MNTGGPIRVMLVDDHTLVRQGIAALLERDPEVQVVAEAADAEDAIPLYRQHTPDVLLVDLRLPGMDGVQLVRTLREEFPRGRFVALTTHDGSEDVYQAIRAGAQGYVLKGVPGSELMDAIRAVHAGRRWVPAALADRVVERAAAVELTEREAAVLRLLVAGKSNKEIAVALAVEESTVKTHVTAVFHKLGVSSRAQAIVAALQRGLVKLGG